jgi:hypothetical protein
MAYSENAIYERACHHRGLTDPRRRGFEPLERLEPHQLTFHPAPLLVRFATESRHSHGQGFGPLRSNRRLIAAKTTYA